MALSYILSNSFGRSAAVFEYHVVNRFRKYQKYPYSCHGVCQKKILPKLWLFSKPASPQNICLSFQGDVKLNHFGIYKTTSEPGLTLTGVIKNKRSYQTLGKKTDHQSVSYALGIVYYKSCPISAYTALPTPLRPSKSLIAGAIVSDLAQGTRFSMPDNFF